METLEENNNCDFDAVSAVVVEPPDVRPETDKDSENEEPTERAANRLTGFQLRVPAHVRQEENIDLQVDAQPATAEVRTRARKSAQN